MNYKEIIENIDVKCKQNECNYSFCNINFKIAFNNNYLEREFSYIIYPHIIKTSTNNIDFKINAVVDDTLFLEINDELNQNENKEILTMTFCTTEKGTIRVNKYKYNDFMIFTTIKTDSILLVDSNYLNFTYITSNNNMNKKSFYKDFYMYFEHIVHKKCNEKGSVLIHASAVVDDGKVILFTGKKRSGKTTMLFECCKKLNLHPLSIDKVHLVLQDDCLKVFSFPTRLRVLAGTLSRYSELKHMIPSNYINASDDDLWKGKSDSKVDMKLSEFENFARKKFQTTGTLSLIVLSNVSQDNVAEKIYSEDKENLNSKLLENIYTPDNPEEDWWSGIGIDNYSQIDSNKNNVLSFIYNNIDIKKVNARKNIADLMNKVLYDKKEI